MPNTYPDRNVRLFSKNVRVVQEGRLKATTRTDLVSVGDELDVALYAEEETLLEQTL